MAEELNRSSSLPFQRKKPCSHANASHFWLNEGWTTYIERLLLQIVHSPAHRGYSFLIGFKELYDDLKLYESRPKYQRLVIDFEYGENPDDAYSSVPYEKGANLLLLLERTLGGLDVFLPYVKDYVRTFMGKSITTEQWKTHLYEYYRKHGTEENIEALDTIDWEAWMFGEGLTLPVQMEYDTTLVQQSNALAKRWDNSRDVTDLSKVFDPSDLQELDANQIIAFLDRLQAFPALPKTHINYLGDVYGFSGTQNAEIRQRFYAVALLDSSSPSAKEYAKQAATWVVGKEIEGQRGVVKGRMKFCRPIFRSIHAVDQELAIGTYLENKLGFHPIARNLIEKSVNPERQLERIFVNWKSTILNMPDPTTQSNYLEIAARHLSLDWTIDFNAQAISGRAVYELEVRKEGVYEAIFDTADLSIESIEVEGVTAETYDARVTAILPVLMSAMRVSPPSNGPPHDGKEIGKEEVLYVYRQPVPIPSYLLAIASADVRYKPLPVPAGKEWTCGVWAEEELIDAAEWEFKEDTAKYLQEEEKITVPYHFGVYDLLVLPPSFPYGGMIVHTPAHRGFSFLTGSKSLYDDLKRYESNPKYQRLQIDFEHGENPDDAYSRVPYEKGANLILHLERTLGGLDVFLPYVKDYVQTYMGKSITTQEWKDHLYGYYRTHGTQANVEALDSIDWDAWLFGEGLTLPVPMEYDMTLAHQSNALAERWDKSRDVTDLSELFGPSDLQELDTNQIVAFLERLHGFPALPKTHVDYLGEVYGFANTHNSEIRLRFYEVALLDPSSVAAKDYAVQAAAWVVGKEDNVQRGVIKGRMKFCRPIFRAVHAVDKDMAVGTYLEHKLAFHPIARNLIEKRFIRLFEGPWTGQYRSKHPLD
ncbi:hypothetical protein ID866_7842 [Astraeus odoratus]|nr:hypothetical protein ID866_7842 [Astraeus odoratus]